MAWLAGKSGTCTPLCPGARGLSPLPGSGGMASTGNVTARLLRPLLRSCDPCPCPQLPDCDKQDGVAGRVQLGASVLPALHTASPPGLGLLVAG